MSRKVDRSNMLTRMRIHNYRSRMKLKKQETREVTSDSEVDYNLQVHQDVENFERLQPRFHGIEEINSEMSETRCIDDDTNNEIFFSESDNDSYCDSDSDSACEASEQDDVFKFNEKSKIINDLRKWAIKCKVFRSTLDELLHILKPYHPEIPVSAKTLLKTDLGFGKLVKKFNEEDPTDDSDFVYFGISRHLQRNVKVELHINNILELQFSVDGLPLFRSSSVEFWPILGKLSHPNEIYKPFTIAVYSGKGKPKNVEKYLSDFIKELNELLKNGIEIKGKKFQIKIKCFVCDRPARAFIKCIKGHTGYYACERCCVQGAYYKNRVIFASVDSDKRSDESFRNLSNMEHHTGISPLTLIVPPINMVNGFVLDFMHLACLGITKKLLNDYWMSSNHSAKLSRNCILSISQKLMNLSCQVPCEFQRTTRSLGEISKWKATEFRFFLLYSGPFVLKDVLSEDSYRHFLLLHVSCRILSCTELFSQYLNHAHMYLIRFVLLAQQIYGLESQVLNMHSLIHLADDVKNMNCSLSDLTAFPFENALAEIKKCLRSGRKPLSQLCKRMEEQFSVEDNETIYISQLEILKSQKKDDQLNIQKIKYKDFILSTKEPNNVVFLKNGQIVQIEKMFSVLVNNITNIYMIGKTFEKLQSAFEYPSPSSVLKIFKVEECKSLDKIQFILSDVDCKMVFLKVFELQSDEKELYVVPLLH